MATIAQNLQALSDARDDIATAITDKGVILPEGAGFRQFPDAISSIPSGGEEIYKVISAAAIGGRPEITTQDFYGFIIDGYIYLFFKGYVPPSQSDYTAVVDFTFDALPSYITSATFDITSRYNESIEVHGTEYQTVKSVTVQSNNTIRFTYKVDAYWNKFQDHDTFICSHIIKINTE